MDKQVDIVNEFRKLVLQPLLTRWLRVALIGFSLCLINHGIYAGVTSTFNLSEPWWKDIETNVFAWPIYATLLVSPMISFALDSFHHYYGWHKKDAFTLTTRMGGLDRSTYTFLRREDPKLNDILELYTTKEYEQAISLLNFYHYHRHFLEQAFWLKQQWLLKWPKLLIMECYIPSLWRTSLTFEQRIKWDMWEHLDPKERWSMYIQPVEDPQTSTFSTQGLV